MTYIREKLNMYTYIYERHFNTCRFIAIIPLYCVYVILYYVYDYYLYDCHLQLFVYSYYVVSLV